METRSKHLYGLTDELNNLINSSDMNAKRVRVAGRYYVTTNAILVSDITILDYKKLAPSSAL